MNRRLPKNCFNCNCPQELPPCSPILASCCECLEFDNQYPPRNIEGIASEVTGRNTYYQYFYFLGNPDPVLLTLPGHNWNGTYIAECLRTNGYPQFPNQPYDFTHYVNVEAITGPIVNEGFGAWYLVENLRLRMLCPIPQLPSIPASSVWVNFQCTGTFMQATQASPPCVTGIPLTPNVDDRGCVLNSSTSATLGGLVGEYTNEFQPKKTAWRYPLHPYDPIECPIDWRETWYDCDPQWTNRRATYGPPLNYGGPTGPWVMSHRRNWRLLPGAPGTNIVNYQVSNIDNPLYPELEPDVGVSFSDPWFILE